MPRTECCNCSFVVNARTHIEKYIHIMLCVSLYGALKDAFLKKYAVTVTRENEKQVEIPFVFLDEEEMAETPYNMSPMLGRESSNVIV